MSENKDTRFSAKDRLQSILSSRKRTIVPSVSKGEFHDERLKEIEELIMNDVSNVLKISRENIKLNYEEGPGYLVMVITINKD